MLSKYQSYPADISRHWSTKRHNTRCQLLKIRRRFENDYLNADTCPSETQWSNNGKQLQQPIYDACSHGNHTWDSSKSRPSDTGRLMAFDWRCTWACIDIAPLAKTAACCPWSWVLWAIKSGRDRRREWREAGSLWKYISKIIYRIKENVIWVKLNSVF